VAGAVVTDASELPGAIASGLSLSNPGLQAKTAVKCRAADRRQARGQRPGLAHHNVVLAAIPFDQQPDGGRRSPDQPPVSESTRRTRASGPVLQRQLLQVCALLSAAPASGRCVQIHSRRWVLQLGHQLMGQLLRGLVVDQLPACSGAGGQNQSAGPATRGRFPWRPDRGAELGSSAPDLGGGWPAWRQNWPGASAGAFADRGAGGKEGMRPAPGQLHRSPPRRRPNPLA